MNRIKLINKSCKGKYRAKRTIKEKIKGETIKPKIKAIITNNSLIIFFIITPSYQKSARKAISWLPQQGR